jgi:hypothetical protein
MNRRNILILAPAVAVGAIIFAWHAHQTYRAVEAERRELRLRRPELTAQLQRWETIEKQASSDAAVLPPKPMAAATAEKTAPASMPPSRAKAADSLLEWLEDPKVQVLDLARQRAELGRSYGLFFRTQHLTTDQIEKVCDLIIQSRAHLRDLSEINRTQGIAFDDPAMKAQRASDEAETRAGLTGVLGEAGYRQMKDYARALEIRTFVGQLAGAAAVEGTPLTLEQADALAQAIASTTPTYSLGGEALITKVDWSKADGQAAQILSPAQLKLLHGGSPAVSPRRQSSMLSRAVLNALREQKESGGAANDPR